MPFPLMGRAGLVDGREFDNSSGCDGCDALHTTQNPLSLWIEEVKWGADQNNSWCLCQECWPLDQLREGFELEKMVENRREGLRP